MKRKISDMMDGFPVDDVELECSTPLSSQRIKELTMNKVNKPRKGRKLGVRVLLIAAVVALLTVTVFAAETVLTYDNWMKDFFSGKTVIADISENQWELLDQSIVQLNQSVTDGGYTVTLEQAVTDGYVSYLLFRVVAPEGTVLDGSYYKFAEVPLDMFGETGGDENRVSSMGWEMLDDGDATDNSILLLLKGETSSTTESTSPMVTGKETRICLNTLEQLDVENQSKHVVAEGNWTFRFSFLNSGALTQEVEMLSEPLRCTGNRMLRSKFFDVTVKVTSFKLRALTASLVYEKPLTGYWEGIHLDAIYIVMKDGSSVRARYSSGITQENSFACIYEFDVPISFADVDYIAFPGGDRAYMSE